MREAAFPILGATSLFWPHVASIQDDMELSTGVSSFEKNLDLPVRVVKWQLKVSQSAKGCSSPQSTIHRDRLLRKGWNGQHHCPELLAKLSWISLIKVM